MKIGILKERKIDEYRVSLLPEHVKILTDNGHEVYVGTSAGLKAGFPDEEYLNSGAIITHKDKVLAESELLLKVKAPLKYEYNDFKEHQTLFCYLHFDENISPEEIGKMTQSGFLGIALEWVEKNGTYPLLEPMSKISGYLFAQKAIQLCAEHKGLLCGAYEKLNDPASILIIGMGTIGASVFKYASDNHLNISILDKNPNTLNDRLNKRFVTSNIDYISDFKLGCLSFDNSIPEKSKAILSEKMSEFDIIINCAVRRDDLPKIKLEYLIDKEMIGKMQPGSVVCDSTACDKDLIETCISSEKIDHFDSIEGVIHYNCDHIPSLTANTSSKLLTRASFPYILEMADKGIHQSIKENDALRKAVSCYKGHLTHEYSAIKKNIPWKKINELS